MEWGNIADKRSGFGPAPKAGNAQTVGPYAKLKGGIIAPKAAPAESKASAPVAGQDSTTIQPPKTTTIDTTSLFGPEADKGTLVKKLAELKDNNHTANAKWWSFCKVHGEGKLDARAHDVPFLLTFFESFDLNEIPDEPGCPFSTEAPKGTGKGGAQGKATPAHAAGPQQRLFVAGLPKTTTEDALWQHFKWYGTVESVDLKYDQETGGFKGFGFVMFAEKDGASKVVSSKDANYFQGKWIDVQIASPSGKEGQGGQSGKGGKGDKGSSKGGKGGSDKGKKGGAKGDKGQSKGDKGGKGNSIPAGTPEELKVFVGGLPKDCTVDKIQNFMSGFGNVTNVDLKYDEVGTFRGFGFVSFDSANGTQAALANTDKNYLEGKWIDVRSANQRNGSGSGGGGKGGASSGGKGSKGGGDYSGWGWGAGGGGGKDWWGGGGSMDGWGGWGGGKCGAGGAKGSSKGGGWGGSGAWGMW